MPISSEPFGTCSTGEPIIRYTLTNENGLSVSVLNLGCVLQQILVPNRNGHLTDVCLGFSDGFSYEPAPGSMGAVVGRHANRIKNAQFSIDGQLYQVTPNALGHNHIHGGKKGFSTQLWNARVEEAGVIFSLSSPDGEEGYPGNLNVTVSYQLTKDNELKLHYIAETDQDTVINLTNHCYFNLAGEGNGDILDHVTQIFSDSFTAVDEESCPTGSILSVEHTPFDFRQPKPIGRDIEARDDQLQIGGGYDHNFILGDPGIMRKAAIVSCPRTGIEMVTFTDQPGVQFYTSNSMNMQGGKHSYGPRTAFCLETQHFPNSTACPNFPTVILRKGERYDYTTIYQFNCLK